LKKAKFSKAIGIVGGAGPAASAFLYTTLIELCQKQYGSNDYNEFPEIILESFPFIRDAEKIRQDISLCLAKLKSAGADLFCIASHSFHGYLPAVPSAFINLVSESLQEASRCNISKALILASQTTIDLKLYEQHGCYPSKEDQKAIQTIIREVAGGTIAEPSARALQEMVNRLRPKLHFDGVILACTELPLLYRKFPFSTKLLVIDTTEVLAKKLLDAASI
jgi:aspartate racemase